MAGYPLLLFGIPLIRAGGPQIDTVQQLEISHGPAGPQVDVIQQLEVFDTPVAAAVRRMEHRVADLFIPAHLQDDLFTLAVGEEDLSFEPLLPACPRRHLHLVHDIHIAVVHRSAEKDPLDFAGAGIKIAENRRGSSDVPAFGNKFFHDDTVGNRGLRHLQVQCHLELGPRKIGRRQFPHGDDLVRRVLRSSGISRIAGAHGDGHLVGIAVIAPVVHHQLEFQNIGLTRGGEAGLDRRHV